MSLGELKLEIGKSYNIDHVIEILKTAPEVQLGHIVIAMSREHKYHVNVKQLEELSKKIKEAIIKGGKEYERIGKKFVPLTDITILSVLDPYEKYEKFSLFYESFEPQILQGIKESKKDQIYAPIEAIISEAKNIFPGLKEKIEEEEEDFIFGMEIYFRRKGIRTSRYEGKYIAFEKERPTYVQKGVKIAITDIKAAEKEYEKRIGKYEDYEKFYNSFLKQIIESLETGKEKIAAHANAIIDEATKVGCIIENNEDFLKGLVLYFKTKGIYSERLGEYLMFKK